MSEFEIKNSLKGIKVPRTTFVNDEGHKIVFQGMIHIGDKRFYNKIIKDCENFDGEVHFESIRNADKDIVSQSLKIGYEILALLNSVETQSSVMTKEFMNSQPNKFKNYDADFEDIKSFLHSKDTMESIKELADTDEKLFANRFLIAATFNPLVMSKILNKDSAIDLNKAVVENRDEVSSTKAIESSVSKADEKKNDVLMIWGSKHINGISERLLKRNYQITNIEWDTVIPWIKSNKIPHKIRQTRLLNSKKELLEKIESDEWQNLWAKVTNSNVDSSVNPEELPTVAIPVVSSSVPEDDESHVYEKDDPAHGDYSI